MSSQIHPTPELAQQLYNEGEISYADLAFINDTHAVEKKEREGPVNRMVLSDIPISVFPPQEDNPPNPFIPKKHQQGTPPWQPYWKTEDGGKTFTVEFPWNSGGGIGSRSPGDPWPDGSGKIIPEPTPEERVAVLHPEMADLARAKQALTPETFIEYCGQLASQLSGLVLEARSIITMLREVKAEARRVSRLRAKRLRKEAALQTFREVQAREREKEVN